MHIYLRSDNTMVNSVEVYFPNKERRKTAGILYGRVKYKIFLVKTFLFCGTEFMLMMAYIY